MGSYRAKLNAVGIIGELYDVAVVPGVIRTMSLGFSSNEVLNLITHDPLEEGAAF